MLLELALTACIVTRIGALDQPRKYADRAQAALIELAPLSLPFLDEVRRTGQPGASARAAGMLTSLVKVHPHWFAERMLPDGWPTLPWIDMLPAEFPNRSSVFSDYLKLGEKLEGSLGDQPHWRGYRRGTQELIEQLLAEGWTIPRVQTLLNEMRDIERVWIIEHADNYDPPLRLPGQGGGVGPIH